MSWLVLVLMASLTTAGILPSDPVVVLGVVVCDINSDGRIDGRDLLRLYVERGRVNTGPDRDGEDPNDDGVTSIADVVYCARQVTR